LILKKKSLDLFDQFISMAERETDIRVVLSDNGLFVFNFCRPIVYLYKFDYFATTIGE